MSKKILVAVVTVIIVIGAILGCIFLLGNDKEPVDATPTETPVVTEAPTEAPTPEPTEEPTPEPTEAPTPEPTEPPFVWEDIEGTDGKNYHPTGDISFYAEPRMDSEVMQTLTVDMVFQYNAKVFINGEDSYFVRVEIDGQQGYVVYPQLIAVEDEAELPEVPVTTPQDEVVLPTPKPVTPDNQPPAGYDPWSNFQTYPDPDNGDSANALMDELGITFE